VEGGNASGPERAMAPKRGAKAASAAEDYESWDVAKLKAKAQELGLRSSGSKKDLIERLKACAPACAEEKAAAPKKRAAKEPETAQPPAKRAKVEPPAPKARGEPKAPARGKAKAKAKGRAAPDAEEEDEEEEPAETSKPSRSSPKAKAEPAGQQAKAKAKAKAKSAPEAPSEIEIPPLSSIKAAEGEIFYEDGEFCTDEAKSGKAQCRKCKERIPEKSLRFGKLVASDKFDGKMTLWYHAHCFLGGNELPSSTNLIAGFSSLRPDQQKIIEKFISKGGDGTGSDSKLKAQSKKVHEIQDVLQKLSTAELNEMAELNGYPTKKLHVSSTLLQLCADGILFGACDTCEVCKDHGHPGSVLLDGEVYRCTGWMTDHLKCSFQTQSPERSVWKLTPAAENVSNGKLGKMNLKVGKRIFATKMKDDGSVPTSSISSTSSTAKPPLLNLTVVLAEGLGSEEKRQELSELIRSHGGAVGDTVTKATCFVVSSSELAEEQETEVEAAKAEGVPGVDEEFLRKLEAGTITDMTPHLLWGVAHPKFRKIEEKNTQKFVEKDGVNMDTDVGELAERAHVLVDRSQSRVYSEMLSQTDMVTGTNSFYMLHLLESDKDSSEPCYWVFRKWGRIGVNQGGTKLEEFGTDKAGAIKQFSKLYLDKSGNTFGHKPNEFVQKPGKFGRVDVAHKALQKGNKKAKTEESSQDASKEKGEEQQGQPLGQLSKAQIEKGNAVLDGIDSLLGEIGEGGSANPVQAGKIKALSAEYYALIPHNFGLKVPPPIGTQELLGAERALLQFYLRMGFEEIGGEDEEKLAPIAGVMLLPLPKSLAEASKGICKPKEVTSCTKKGKTLEAKKAGKPLKAMDQDLYGSILLYTSNAIYKQLNKALRDEDREQVKAFFPYLRILFEACARLPTRTCTLWRGVGVDLFDQYKVGSTITWWGVSSCTSDQKVAQNFANGCAGQSTVLTVETSTACEISELSFYANESESILLPGTQLEVISSVKKGNQAHIRLREVGRVVG